MIDYETDDLNDDDWDVLAAQQRFVKLQHRVTGQILFRPSRAQRERDRARHGAGDPRLKTMTPHRSLPHVGKPHPGSTPTPEGPRSA